MTNEIERLFRFKRSQYLLNLGHRHNVAVSSSAAAVPPMLESANPDVHVNLESHTVATSGTSAQPSLPMSTFQLRFTAPPATI